MLLRPVRLCLLTALSALVALTASALLPPARPALAFPPPGVDILPVAGAVSVSSRIGQETIALSGTATVQRSAVQMQGGVEVVPAEIIALSLSGMSVTGPVSVLESTTLASSGELRALQPGYSYPASSYFDVYVKVTAPASNGTPTVTSMTLSNSTALRVVPGSSILEWPPVSATYSATPNPCVPLAPALPKQICITSLAFKVSGGTAAVGGVASLPEIAGAAARDHGPSRSQTLAGMAIGLLGLAVAGAAGWYLRRLFAR
jgi:hypothetical protein